MASANFSNYNITITIDIPNISKLNTAINTAMSGVKQTVVETKKVKKEIDSTEKSSGKVSNNIKKLNVDLVKARRQSNSFLKDWERMTIVINQLAELLRKFFIFFNLIMKPVSEAASFEQFRVTLKNLMGDVEAADSRFREMVRFAAKTPFNVPGIVEAGNRLQALGQYSLKTIEMLGDLAAASGKDVSQAIEAYTNLVVGRTGMAVKQFRALLISNADWSRETGKQVLRNTGEVSASIQEMLDALPKIIAKKGFSKLMIEQSKTLKGIISNFEDAIQRTMAGVGDKFLPQTKSLYTALIDLFEKLEKNANKIYKIILVLGNVLKLASFIILLKQLVKIVALVRTQFFLLERFIKSFATSFLVLKNSLVSLKNTTMLIVGTIKQGTLATIKWGVAFKTLGGYIITAGRAFMAIFGKFTAALLVVASIVDLFKSAKNVFEEDIDERIENTQEIVESQKNYASEQEEQLKLEEERIKSLKNLIEVENKYSNNMKQKEKELKNSNIPLEKQGIILQRTRESIEEYNSSLRNAKDVYPELINKTNEFELANKNNEETINLLNSELRNSEKKFNTLKEVIINTTESIVRLRIELAKLNLEKSLDEANKNIMDKLNNLPIFSSAIKNILNVFGIDLSKSTEDLSKKFSELQKNIQNTNKYTKEYILTSTKSRDAQTKTIKEEIQITDNMRKSLKLLNVYLKSLQTNNVKDLQKYFEQIVNLSSDLSGLEFSKSLTELFKFEFGNIDGKDKEKLNKQLNSLYAEILANSHKFNKDIQEVNKQYAESYRETFEKVLNLHKNNLTKMFKDDLTVNEKFKENLSKLANSLYDNKELTIDLTGSIFELEKIVASVPLELTFIDNNGKEISVKNYLSEQINKAKEGKDLNNVIDVKFKFPTLKDSKALLSLIAELENKADLIIESITEQNEQNLKSRLKNIKETLGNFNRALENLFNNLNINLNNTIEKYTKEVPALKSPEFIEKSFEYFKQFNDNFSELQKKFDLQKDKLAASVSDLNKNLEEGEAGLLNQFNDLVKKMTSANDKATIMLAESLKNFSDYVINLKELGEEGLLLSSDIGFEGKTEDVINFLENYANTILDTVNKLNKANVKIDKIKIFETIRETLKNINDLKNQLAREKSVKLKLDDLLQIIPVGLKTKEEVEQFIENNVVGYLIETADNLKNRVYEISPKVDIKPVINVDDEDKLRDIIKYDIDYLIEKIKNEISKEDITLDFVIKEMKADNVSEVTINEKLMKQYKERISYLNEIITLVNNTKLYSEEELGRIEEQIKQLENLKSITGELSEQQQEEYNNLKIKENELNEQTLKKVAILKTLEEMLEQIISKLKEVELANKNAFGKKLEDIMNNVLDVYNAIYENLNKIGQTYFENMINNAKKEAEIFLDLQNKKIDMDEKLAMNYARTELQKEKAREAIEEKRKQAQEKARKIELEARRKQFEFEKKMAVAQALMNIAVAVTKIFSQTGTLGFFIAAGVEAFLNAVYIPMILSQEFPEYKKGGYTGDVKEDEPAGVVHGKEFVVNAKATKKHRQLLEKINEDKLEDFEYKKGGLVSVNKISYETDLSSIEKSIENINKFKENISSFNKLITDIGRKNLYNNIKLKLNIDTSDINKINIKNKFSEFDKQILLSKNQTFKLPAVNNRINLSNDDLLKEIKSLNENLVYYFENPTPSIAYLNDNEAEKITKIGLKKIQRKLG